MSEYGNDPDLDAGGWGDGPDELDAAGTGDAMSDEESPHVVTEDDVRRVDAEAAHAAATARGLLNKGRSMEKKARELALTHDTLREFVGRPVTDIEQELAKAEEQLAAVAARIEVLRERKRDVEGYVRILKEQHPELADEDTTATGTKRKD